MKKIIFIILLGLGIFYYTNSKADLAMDSIINPAYAAMPQNLYHNTIYGHKSSNNNFDKCKTPGSVRKIIVEKSNKKMYLLDVNDCIVKEYTVRVGKNKGPKQCEGDKKTPEGIYKIKDKRDSKYIRFLELDYPKPKDLIKAEELGCNPGNAIGIHYFNQDVMDKNTQYSGSNGCITVWNKDEIREISRLVSIGTTVEIKE